MKKHGIYHDDPRSALTHGLDRGGGGGLDTLIFDNLTHDTIPTLISSVRDERGWPLQSVEKGNELRQKQESRKSKQDPIMY